MATKRVLAMSARKEATSLSSQPWVFIDLSDDLDDGASTGDSACHYRPRRRPLAAVDICSSSTLSAKEGEKLHDSRFR
jgi:hypothetical protein